MKSVEVIPVSVHKSNRRTGCRVPHAIALAICLFTMGIALVSYTPSGRALGRSVIRKIGQNARSAPAVTPASVPPVTRFYAATSFWNSPIVPNRPIDADSANMISSSILPYATRATLNNTDWGIAFVVGSPTDPAYNVTCTIYCDQGTSFSIHIPAGTQPSVGSDHHLVVRNGDTEYDMWVASYNARDNTWSANAVNYTSITGWGAECTPGQHCNSAVAAGFAGMGGVIRPEEIQQGHIDHALSLVIPGAKAGYIACPATHTDGNKTEPPTLQSVTAALRVCPRARARAGTTPQLARSPCAAAKGETRPCRACWSRRARAGTFAGGKHRCPRAQPHPPA